MKRFATLAFAVFLVVVASPLHNAAQPALHPQAGITAVQTVLRSVSDLPLEDAIQRLLVVQTQAWNRGDLEGFMNGYWRSPDLTFFSGATIANGWQAALERYQRRYQGTGREMGHLEFQDLNINVLSPDAAFVRGKWELTMSDGKKPHGLFTLILKNMQNGWHIVHDHTSSAENSN